MHRDIDHTRLDLLLGDRRNGIGNTLCNLNPARWHAGEDNGIEFRICLNDFVRDARSAR